MGSGLLHPVPVPLLLHLPLTSRPGWMGLPLFPKDFSPFSALTLQGGLAHHHQRTSVSAVVHRVRPQMGVRVRQSGIRKRMDLDLSLKACSVHHDRRLLI